MDPPPTGDTLVDLDLVLMADIDDPGVSSSLSPPSKSGPDPEELRDLLLGRPLASPQFSFWGYLFGNNNM